VKESSSNIFNQQERAQSNFYEMYNSHTLQYSSDKRFVPAGPRPPVPPVGGYINYNDAADTINKNQRCLQSFST